MVGLDKRKEPWGGSEEKLKTLGRREWRKREWRERKCLDG